MPGLVSGYVLHGSPAGRERDVVLGGVVRSAGLIAGVAGSVTGGVTSAACRAGTGAPLPSPRRLVGEVVGAGTQLTARAATEAALVGTQLGQTLLIGWRSPLVMATTLASVAA
jgi:hypothetical protein